jgi:hypothetical protein
LVDLPNKNNLFVFNENPAEPLILSIGFGSTTRVVILKLNLETNRWTKLQSMHFKPDYIKHYVVDGKLYLIGCTTDAFCAIYKWTNDHFRRHSKLDSQVFEKIKDIYYQHDIVVMENFQEKLSFYSSDDIVSVRPGLTRDASTNLSNYAIFKSPIHNKMFFVEFIFNKTSIAINFFDLSVDKVKEESDRDGRSLKDPMTCIKELKAILKTRFVKIQSSHDNVSKLKC